MVSAPSNVPAPPILNLTPVVKALCLINLSVQLLQSFLTDDLLYALAFVPARYTGDGPLEWSALTSPLTHQFVHGGWLHLGMNMAALMAFGSGLEKTMGGKRMLALYLATGFAGAAFHALLHPHDTLPMVGASGAISGLFGGVLMAMYSGTGGRNYRQLLPAVIVWLGASAFFGLLGMPGVDAPIAWLAHVGGFLAGLFLYAALRPSAGPSSSAQ